MTNKQYKNLKYQIFAGVLATIRAIHTQIGILSSSDFFWFSWLACIICIILLLYLTYWND